VNKQKIDNIPEEFKQGIQVTDTLDLHGFFPEQIPEIVESFIENARELHLQTLRIIHGKGKSRLKFEVHRVLKKSPQVKKFYDASWNTGGWGATMVELL
jgi:DNA mismatch repair protein MutS2